MIQFIHTADIHFGMENYGKLDPKTGIHTRLLDFEKALNFCIDYAIEQKVDFFLFSGDAYKTAHPTPTQQKLLLQCFLRLHKAHIPVIIIVGNHDNPLSFGKANSLEIFGDMPLDGFHVFTKPGILKLETKNGPIQIVGIPWPTRNTLSLNASYEEHSEAITRIISQAVASLVKQYALQLDHSIPSVLASHLTVSSGIFSGSEKRAIYGNDPVLMPSELAIEPFDYIALGHLHRYQDLNPKGYPAIVYSGSIERIDFGERKEPKGFCHVNLVRKKTTHKFIEGPMRPFHQIDVTLTPDHDQTETILHAIEKVPLEQAVVKIVYRLPSGLKDSVDIRTIEHACRKAHYLVSIVPIHDIVTRSKRMASHTQTMNLETLLDTYFIQKNESSKMRELLIKKGMELHAKAQTDNEE